MRAILPVIALCLLALPAGADIGRRAVDCETISAAPGCLAAAELRGFVPSGGMVVLGDRLRLAGIEQRPGDPDRLVILDLSLPDGTVQAVIPLAGEPPLTAATEFSPDGTVLLVAPPPEPSASDTDALMPRELLVFDDAGQQTARSTGLAVTALADAFGENRLAFDKGFVTLTLDGVGVIRIDLATGAVAEGGLIPDGEWLYDALFDRVRGWHQGDMVVKTDWNRDGMPSSVMLQSAGASEARTLIGNPPGTYDREFARPVLSPDAGRLAVLQLADGAPGPILLALALPSGNVIWRAMVHQTEDRPVQYRWTERGALVLLQPHPVFGDVTLLLVHQP